MSTAPKPKVKVIKADPAAQPNDDRTVLLSRLIALEGEALSAADRRALKHIAVNRVRALLPIGHAFLLTRTGTKFKFQAISNQAKVNDQSPFLQWLGQTLKDRARIGQRTQKLARRRGAANLDSSPAAANDPAAESERGDNENDFTTGFPFTLQARRRSDDFDYPFSHAFWAPFQPEPGSGGLLFTRDTPWEDTEQLLLQRIAALIGTSWMARKRVKSAKMDRNKKWCLWALAAAVIAAGFIPVPMTTMAPAEIVADSPYIVTAPINGVIDSIQIKPGDGVQNGTVLVKLNDVKYRNDHELAGEEKALAAARVRNASLGAFNDRAAKREMAIAKAEHDLAGARQDFAADMLAKTKLKSPQSGLALYSDEKDWAGRPVSIGEKILEIADPARVLLRIESPIAHSGTLQSGARVRLFMDADALKPVEARLLRANFYAAPSQSGALAYEAYAELLPDQDIPRIGGRGVVKIYGETASLGFWLARRPLTIARQMIGY